MDLQIKYDIIYSITAHESVLSLKNLIENIFLHNFNYKIGIILHLNSFMMDSFNTNIKDIYINNIYYDKHRCNHTILKAHIENFLFLKKKKIKFLYYIPISSNCMFIKQMNIPTNYVFENKICEEDFSIKDDEKGWHWVKILKNKYIINLLKDKKIPIRIGFHEGRIIFYDLMEKITNFICNNKIFENIDQECVFEEFLLPSLEAYFNNSYNCQSILKLFKTLLNKNDIINEKNLNFLSNKTNLILVKRVPRDINNDIRILVNNYTNINHNKNGHFSLDNNTAFINYYNFYCEKLNNQSYPLEVKKLNYNSFELVNFEDSRSLFEYDFTNDIWIEKRFYNLLSKEFKVYKWNRSKPKKIAIIIKGATGKINNWGLINFDECYQSFKTNILNYFKNLNYDVDIYIHTYKSNNEKKIINLLKPKKIIFEEFNQNSNQLNSLNKIINEVPEDYDSYLIVRFDILYKKSMNYFNINFNESYYLFNQPNNTINDILFIISKNNFTLFKKYLSDIIKKKVRGLHTLKLPFEIKTICKNKYYSDTDYPEIFILNNNPIYKLSRNRSWGFKSNEDAIKECIKQKKLKKKIAILLYGLSYCENFKHFNKKQFNINYKKSLENYKNVLFNYFNSNYFDIDIFICTNKSKKNDELINDFKPKKYLFIEDNINNMKTYYDENKSNILEKNKLLKIQHPERYYYTNIKKLSVLKLCKEYSEENKIKYNNIIITRFDLKFNISFEEANINYGMFNVISMLEKPNLIDDNFYLFPYYNINNLIKILEENLCEWGHSYKKYFDDIFDLNFLYNENKNIKFLSFYSINR